MGVVYVASDDRLGRRIALKVLPPDVNASPSMRARFLAEARAASALQHPNIVSIFDVGSSDGSDYFAMELIEGESLRVAMRDRPVPIEKTVRIASDLAAALEAAHARGIAHRDLKPENIVLTRTGEAKILDFGLAKVVAYGASSQDATTVAGVLTTDPGTLLGTVAYMSPEQAEGATVDHRTDIFSLGVILYELLTGRRPFSGKSSIDLLHQIINADPRPAHELNTRIPAPLLAILDKCLAKDPTFRYACAADLRLDLLRVKREDWAATTVRKQSRIPWTVAALMAALAIVASLLSLRREDGPPATVSAPAPTGNLLSDAKFTRFTDFPGSESDAAISRDGRFVVFRSDRSGPLDTWVGRVGAGHFVNLTNGLRSQVLVRNAGFTADGSEVWLAAITGGDQMRLMPLTGGATRPFQSSGAFNVAWSPDGNQTVFHTNDPGDPMFVADRNGANSRAIFSLSAGSHNHFPAWSPNGQWIYFVSGVWDTREMDLWRIRAAGGTAERLTRHNSDVRYPTPIDDRTVLYVSPDQDGAGPWLWIVDPERKISRRISFGLETYSSIDASADGSRLVATVSNPTASLWTVPIMDHPAEEEDVKPFPVPSTRAHAPRYGGASLFYLSSRGGADGLWRFVDGHATEIWRGVDGALLEPAASSPDGRRVAVILRKAGKRTLHSLLSDGGDVRVLAPTIDVNSAVSWSPDGKWIAAAGADGTGPGLFKILVDGGDVQRLVAGPASNPVWSPDGSVIVYTGPVVSAMGSLAIIRPDGVRLELPPIQVRVNTEHYRFIPGQRKLVYLPHMSQALPENFRLLDLDSGKSRQLARFDSRLTRTFDITPDGNHIVFDRLRDNSDIVLIDLPRSPTRAAGQTR